MTREESDALDLKIIDFEKRREEELAKRAALEELVINESDPTETAKTLAVLFTRRDDFLSKGYVPVQVVTDADNMPRAVEVTIESVRIHAHEICKPIKERHTKRGTEMVAVPLSRDIAQLYLCGLEGRWGLRIFAG